MRAVVVTASAMAVCMALLCGTPLVAGADIQTTVFISSLGIVRGDATSGNIHSLRTNDGSALVMQEAFATNLLLFPEVQPDGDISQVGTWERNTTVFFQAIDDDINSPDDNTTILVAKSNGARLAVSTDITAEPDFLGQNANNVSATVRYRQNTTMATTLTVEIFIGASTTCEAWSFPLVTSLAWTTLTTPVDDDNLCNGDPYSATLVGALNIRIGCDGCSGAIPLSFTQVYVGMRVDVPSYSVDIRPIAIAPATTPISMSWNCTLSGIASVEIWGLPQSGNKRSIASGADECDDTIQTEPVLVADFWNSRFHLQFNTVNETGPSTGELHLEYLVITVQNEIAERTMNYALVIGFFSFLLLLVVAAIIIYRRRNR